MVANVSEGKERVPQHVLQVTTDNTMQKFFTTYTAPYRSEVELFYIGK